MAQLGRDRVCGCLFRVCSAQQCRGTLWQPWPCACLAWDLSSMAVLRLQPSYFSATLRCQKGAGWGLKGGRSPVHHRLDAEQALFLTYVLSSKMCALLCQIKEEEGGELTMPVGSIYSQLLSLPSRSYMYFNDEFGILLQKTFPDLPPRGWVRGLPLL